MVFLLGFLLAIADEEFIEEEREANTNLSEVDQFLFLGKFFFSFLS